MGYSGEHSDVSESSNGKERLIGNEYVEKHGHPVDLARPTGRGWSSFITKGMPAVSFPEDFDADPNKYTLPVRMRICAYFTIIIPVCTVFLALNLLPSFLTKSPVALTMGAAGEAIGGKDFSFLLTYGVLIAIFGVIVYFATMMLRRGVLGQFLFYAALTEEAWFRYGSENWTFWQRVSSALRFGVAHIANLIVSFVVLGSLSIVGWVFMLVYLNEYKKSGDPEKSLHMSAHFHKHYNYVALGIAFLAFTLLVLFFTIDVLMILIA